MSAEIPARELREAIALAIAGDWQRSHEIVQRYEDDQASCWAHAVLHRIEGDLDNARYWYRRAGRQLNAEVAALAELENILSTLN